MTTLSDSQSLPNSEGIGGYCAEENTESYKESNNIMNDKDAIEKPHLVISLLSTRQ